MAGAGSITSLIKSHPTSLKENLTFICDEAGVEHDSKDTKIVLQVKINEYSDQSATNETRIREAIDQIKARMTPNSNKEHDLPVESQSQLLFTQTQNKNGVDKECDEPSLDESLAQSELMTLTSKALQSKDDQLKGLENTVTEITAMFEKSVTTVESLIDERKVFF